MTPDGWVNLAQRYQKLNQKNDFLPNLNQIVPWEEFRPLSWEHPTFDEKGNECIQAS